MAGKNKDRSRSKNKRNKNMRTRLDKMAKELELPEDLKMMTAMAVKRYKVEVLLKKIDRWTVYAHDQEEAQKLVLGGQGRDAGSTNPEIVQIRVTEMGDGDPGNAEVVQAAETEKDPKVKSLIEVVPG
jgi:hypothetical protein